MESQRDISDNEAMEAAPSTVRGTLRGRRGGRRGRGCRGRVARSRSRSVASTTTSPPETTERSLLEKLARRKIFLKKLIEEAGLEKLKALAFHMVELNAGLVQELLEDCDNADIPTPSFPNPSSHSLPAWCKCGNCREMPTEKERVCCKKAPHHCISTIPDFEALVLDNSVLSLARTQRRDALVLDEEEEGDYHKAQRYAAYRQFILWKYGYLGEGVRIVIYSCCVWAIRTKFPDPTGQYTGFIAGRLN